MSSQKHNATGRSHQPSKAERQAAMRNLPAHQNKPAESKPEAKVDAETKAEIEKELAASKQDTKPAEPEAKKEAPPLKVIDPNKGAATRSRWSACLKARPGAKLVMGSDIKILPKEAVITAIDLGPTGNPKKRYSATRFEKYGFKGQKGATTTIGKYVEAVKKLSNEHATEAIAIADIAWDINHGFIQVEVPVAHPVDEKQPEQVAEAAHELERKVEEEAVAADPDKEVVVAEDKGEAKPESEAA